MNTAEDRSRRGQSATPRSLDLWDLTPEERVERLAGDAALARDLREAGWKGAEWDFVANILACFVLGLVTAAGFFRQSAWQC